ncbi:MAG: hypothetical protein ABI680_21055 [Chthoniobacteraceae bacterium]
MVKSVTLANTARDDGGFETRLADSVPVEGSGWIAVCLFESSGGRRDQFAHSSPIFIEVPGRPLRPRRKEITYLIQRVEEETARNESVLSPEALDEYRAALAFYQTIGKDLGEWRAQPGRMPKTRRGGCPGLAHGGVTTR